MNNSEYISSPIAIALANSIRARTACVGILGLGYVGLPLARLFIERGFRVLGFDVDQRKIDQLVSGQSYIGQLAGEWLSASVKESRFCPSSNATQLARADVLIICVPTPLTEENEPDLTHIQSTARQIAATLRPGQLVVLESTTYPGTTREVLLPILSATGLAEEQDFFLAYSPERQDPGNPRYQAKNIPKIVAGIGPNSLALAQLLYASVVDQAIPVSSLEVAEASKILENTYRAVNIALVNELKMLFDRLNIDIWEVIAAASTKPFGFQPFYPGPGWGGHCIPIDPFYLSWLARRHRQPTQFIELAGQINTQMPHYVIDRVAQALRIRGQELTNSRICLLGVAYKKDVDDPRESPAFVLLHLLREQGADVCYHDPFIPVLPRMRHHNPPQLASTPLSAEFLASQDCVLIVTDHSQFDYDFIVRHARLVVDTRNATRKVSEHRDKIVKA